MGAGHMKEKQCYCDNGTPVSSSYCLRDGGHQCELSGCNPGYYAGYPLNTQILPSALPNGGATWYNPFADIHVNEFCQIWYYISHCLSSPDPYSGSPQTYCGYQNCGELPSGNSSPYFCD